MTKLLARRWYFTVPFLIATAAGVMYLAETTEPDYVLTSYVLLTPAPSGNASDETKRALTDNPWNALGTTALAQAGKLSIEGKEVVEDLAARGLSDSYVVTLDNFSPIITIEVVGASQDEAIATTDALISMFQTNVTELQKSQGAVDAALIRVRRLPGDKLEARDSNVKRAGVALGATGTLLSCALTIALDALIRRRRRLPEDPFLTELLLPMPPGPSQHPPVWESEPVPRDPLQSTSRPDSAAESVGGADFTVVLPLSLGRGATPP